MRGQVAQSGLLNSSALAFTSAFASRLIGPSCAIGLSTLSATSAPQPENTATKSPSAMIHLALDSRSPNEPATCAMNELPAIELNRPAPTLGVTAQLSHGDYSTSPLTAAARE